MHRTVTKEEIDPMNAPTRTVFFDRSKSDGINKDGINKDGQSKLEQNDKNAKSVKNQPQNVPKSLEKFSDSKISDEKFKEIQKKMEIEKESHSKVKKRLELKTKSVKKAKSTLVETRSKLDNAMKMGNEGFEQNKLEMIGEMSSKMAHDLRNPLTVLQAHVELMQLKQEKQQDENLAYSLTKMEDAITNITNQINDVMDFIRTPKFQLSCCNLKSVLEIIVNGMHFPTTVKLNLLLDSHMVKCDVIKIKGIITNIIQNSLQAIQAKGQMIITLKEVDNYVEVAISDSGDGIPEENLEKIFDPMFTTKPMGTGLGLASCKELIEMHKGTITVKNNPTTFTISLPKYKIE